VIGDT